MEAVSVRCVPYLKIFLGNIKPPAWLCLPSQRSVTARSYFSKELSEKEQPNSPSLLEAFEFREPECKRDLHR